VSVSFSSYVMSTMNDTEVGFFSWGGKKGRMIYLYVKHLSGIKTEYDNELEMTTRSSIVCNSHL